MSTIQHKRQEALAIRNAARRRLAEIEARLYAGEAWLQGHATDTRFGEHEDTWMVLEQAYRGEYDAWRNAERMLTSEGEWVT